MEIGADVFAHEFGLARPDARLAMRRVAHVLCGEYGGQRLYVAKDMQFALDKRDLGIWAAFNGSNVPELAAEHNLTEQQVRNILAYMRKANAGRGCATASFGGLPDANPAGKSI